MPVPTLATADKDVDLRAALPVLSGSVKVRVRDTDRAAGNEDLDSVFIDELFLRHVRRPHRAHYRAASMATPSSTAANDSAIRTWL